MASGQLHNCKLNLIRTDKTKNSPRIYWQIPLYWRDIEQFCLCSRAQLILELFFKMLPSDLIQPTLLTHQHFHSTDTTLKFSSPYSGYLATAIRCTYSQNSTELLPGPGQDHQASSGSPALHWNANMLLVCYRWCDFRDMVVAESASQCWWRTIPSCPEGLWGSTVNF